jgi:pyruvate,water dikinase
MANWVRWLEDLAQDEFTTFGRKCVNLGKMIRDGLPVPSGFAISTGSYEYFAGQGGLQEKINAYLRSNPKATQTDQIEETSRILREMICGEPMPADLEKEVARFYEALCERTRNTNVDVAVRSSGAVSMPGQFESYLFVSGIQEVIGKVIDCWASSFTARAMVSRLEKGMKVEESPIGVAVLKMVNSRCSGIMFTINPITEDRSKTVIEANWGLGESVALGTVTPDWFKVNRITLEIEEKKLGHKTKEVVYDRETGGTKEVDVSTERQEAFCVSDEQIRSVTVLGNQVEEYFGGEPQDIEWAIDSDLPEDRNVLLVQTRPEKTWALKKDKRISKQKGSAVDRIVGLVTEGVKVE